jgi:hypothetical protein
MQVFKNSPLATHCTKYEIIYKYNNKYLRNSGEGEQEAALDDGADALVVELG